MQTTLGVLARLVEGEVIGDPDLPLQGAAILRDAVAGDISFLDHPKLVEQCSGSPVSAVVIPVDWPPIDLPSVKVADVRMAFASIVQHFRPPVATTRLGISPFARIDPTAILEDDVEVHPFAVIGPEVRIARGATIHANAVVMERCQIGAESVIYPGAVLYRDTQIGQRVVIHATAAIGAYGFGYDTIEGRHQRGDQLGYVILEDEVEIGAATTVDRGTYGPTVIGEGTKIDNQVMVAHNCRLGKHNLICSQVGIAGSSTTGDYVVMAGQVGVPDHVTIGHRSILGAKSGVMRDVPDDATMIGIPATPERDQMAKQAAFAKLPEMRRQLRDLKRQVERLTNEVARQAPSTTPNEAA